MRQWHKVWISFIISFKDPTVLKWLLEKCGCFKLKMMKKGLIWILKTKLNHMNMLWIGSWRPHLFSGFWPHPAEVARWRCWGWRAIEQQWCTWGAVTVPQPGCGEHGCPASPLPAGSEGWMEEAAQSAGCANTADLLARRQGRPGGLAWAPMRLRW